MNTYNRFDKLILVNDYSTLKNVGRVYEIANFVEIDNVQTVILREEESKKAVCSIEISELNNYFRKIEEKVWTEWTPFADEEGNVCGFYKTNLKKVKVKLIGGYKSSSTCHKNDKFSLYKGIFIAYKRARVKQLHEVYKNLNLAIDKLNDEIAEVNDEIKNIANALDKVRKG